MERSAIRDSTQAAKIPDFASLHPGYDVHLPSLRGATRRSNPASFRGCKAGLLRSARNDGEADVRAAAKKIRRRQSHRRIVIIA
jgi:predicted alpha/beta hydrolase